MIYGRIYDWRNMFIGIKNNGVYYVYNRVESPIPPRSIRYKDWFTFEKEGDKDTSYKRDPTYIILVEWV